MGKYVDYNNKDYFKKAEESRMYDWEINKEINDAIEYVLHHELKNVYRTIEYGNTFIFVAKVSEDIQIYVCKDYEKALYEYDEEYGYEMVNFKRREIDKKYKQYSREELIDMLEEKKEEHLYQLPQRDYGIYMPNWDYRDNKTILLTKDIRDYENKQDYYPNREY